jgi:hypothetical protein
VNTKPCPECEHLVRALEAEIRCWRYALMTSVPNEEFLRISGIIRDSIKTLEGK